MRTKPWLRLYNEFADDPKIQMLAFDDQRHYIMLLCLKSRGVLDSETPNPEYREKMIARAVGLDLLSAKEVKRRLMEPGLIDFNWQPVKWAVRQFESDTSTERVRKYRERKKRFGNVSPEHEAGDRETGGETDETKGGNASVAEGHAQAGDPTGKTGEQRYGNVSVTAESRAEQSRADIRDGTSPAEAAGDVPRGTNIGSAKPPPKTVEEKDAHLQRLHDQLPPTGSRQAAGSMRRGHVWFWQQMRGRFGQAWYNQHGYEPTPLFIELLDRYNRSGDFSELPRFLERLKIDHKDNFPPTLDRCEQVLERVLTKVAPYDETARRQYWTSHVIAQAEAFCSSLSIAPYATRFGDLRVEIRRNVMDRLSEWLDKSVRWERQTPPIPHKQICDDIDSELLTMLKFFQPASPAQRARDEKLIQAAPADQPIDRRAVGE